MKLDTQFVRAEGFKAFKTAYNPLNRVVYSDLQDWVSCRPSQGIGIKYVQEGEEQYEVDGQLYNVRAGQFLMVNHQQEVTAYVRSRKTVKGLCLYIDPEQVSNAHYLLGHSAEQLLEGEASAKPFEVRQRTYPVRHSPIESIVRSLLHNPQALHQNTGALFEQLALAVVQKEFQVGKEVFAIPAKRSSTREELHQRLTIAKAYMLDNLSQPMLVSEVAREAALSEFHFIRTFRQAFGLSPNQFMQQERIRQAKALLRQPHLSVTDVAAQCGFSDLQYFSRTFKRLAGESPSRFRAQYQ